MNKQLLVGTSMAVVLMVLGGCAIGYDTMMFVSKTNAGFEVDTQPPSFQVSLDRLEAVVAPSYEGGQTPPVLASFQAKGTGGLLSVGLGSAFAAGDAATAIAVLYSSGGSQLRRWNQTADRSKRVDIQQKGLGGHRRSERSVQFRPRTDRKT